MPGIVEQQRGSPRSPQALRGQMQIPPEKAQSYERIVAAGKKILYSEQMAPEIVQMLKEPGEMGDKLGRGVVAMLAFMLEKSNGTLPADLLIPAGVELVAEAGAFLEDSGVPVEDNDVAEGTAVLVEQILAMAGVTIDQLPGMLQGGAPNSQPAPAPMGA